MSEQHLSTVHLYPSEQQTMFDRWRHEWHDFAHGAAGNTELRTELEFCMAQGWKQAFA